MSGSIPHTIALSNHTSAPSTTPGYTTFDVRSDEDTRTTAMNARNAIATSDLVVTLSEEAQALLKEDKRNVERKSAEEHKNRLDYFEDDIEEDF
ncbi:hypothetical protein J9B83_06520 [Marinomonas sp. A79]|uniref:Uncharacterized protein n=1 Tax=Marinomonas vulgaris TaxID=2823372 RepID=A0ABS5HCC1_9GAMM|nr:hypothetical protein [Marinomonas vulgaris]MBR7888594.1 hypothetical protein [Marinomonas vulgaris]